MNIRTVILNILFIIILICLIYFFIYLNNSNFEYFDNEANAFNNNSSDTSNVSKIDISSDTQTGVGSINVPILSRVLNNGFAYNTPLTGVEYANILTKMAKEEQGAKQLKYEDGYDWINIPFVGTRYIYCIHDSNFFGGGWMLAMRSVKGSKNFSYNSDYFKKETTLNDSSDYIKSIIPQDWIDDPNKIELKKSSIGEKIFIDNDSNVKDAPAIYDAKFDTFNHIKAKEWMAIFYVKNPQTGEKIIGGDIPDPAINKRGWVWYEKNVRKTSSVITDSSGIRNSVSDSSQEGISPLQLFAELDANQKLARDLRLNYIKTGYAQNIGGKFTNETGRKNQANFNSGIWSSQPLEGKSFYGINYANTDAGVIAGKSLVRWGFTFNDDSKDNTNDVVGGIGLSYNGEGSSKTDNGYSAGNFENIDSQTKYSNKFYDKPIQQQLRNMSYAVEWYVREVRPSV